MRARGFTLLEVIVALSILALALGAAVRASTSATKTVDELRWRTLAGWVAENRFATLRSSRAWPSLGETRGETEMGGIRFYWRQKVSETPNLRFRRVDYSVGREGDASASGDHTHHGVQLVTVLAKPW